LNQQNTKSNLNRKNKKTSTNETRISEKSSTAEQFANDLIVNSEHGTYTTQNYKLNTWQNMLQHLIGFLILY